MTVQTNTNVANFEGNGVTQIFPIAFKFNNDTDLVVLLVDEATGAASQLTLNSDYTVSGEGDEEGGSITVLVAPATGQRLTVIRRVDILQLLDLRNQGKFFAEVHEAAFDLLTMIAQQHQSEIGLSLRVAETDPQPGRIPPVAQRANMLMAFDASGDPTTALPVADSSTELRQELAAAGGASLVGFGMGTVADELGLVFRPENYGSIGVSVAEDTAAIQAAIDAAAAVGGEVRGRPGVNYQISTVRIKNGLRRFDFSQSLITPDASTAGVTTGAIQLDGNGRFGTGVPVERCVVSVRMDMVNGGRAGIFADGCRDCTFAGNEIYGFTNDPSVNHYGIIFWKASNRNRVIGNKITGVTNPTQRGLLIDFIGENEAFAGYFAKSGATTRATVPCSDNIITENVLINGSYGVNLLGCERTIVSNNVCSGQNHRAIYLAEACAWTLITGNELVNFLSTAVLLGYGCVDNVVADNICKREPGVQPAGTGEAVINITTGAQRNAIRNNKIYADTNYGIYLACNVSHNVVADNEVRGYYIAGIAAESDWEASADRPAGAIYSRPNYATPDSVSPTATAWSYANLEGLVIRGNKVLEGAPARSVAGIYVAQVNSSTNLSVLKNSISDNEVFGNDDMAHYIYIFEESSGKNVNNKLSGNKFTDVSGLPSASKIFMSRGRLHFNYQLGNDIIDSAVTYFADGDNTPSVAFGGSFAMNNSTATSVTYFDDGIDGLECSVRLSLNTTLVHDNAKLRLKGAVNISGVSGSNFIRIRRESGVWFELYRNF